MGFPLVLNSVTLNDLERRNRPNGCVISPNSVAFWADCVKDILFLTLITSSAGALELDSMLWRLRSQRLIIIIIINRVDRWRNLCTSLLYFVVRARCCRKESSRSLSHLLMSFLQKSSGNTTLRLLEADATCSARINMQCNANCIRLIHPR